MKLVGRRELQSSISGFDEPFLKMDNSLTLVGSQHL